MAWWGCSIATRTKPAPPPQPAAPLWPLLPQSMPTYLQANNHTPSRLVVGGCAPLAAAPPGPAPNVATVGAASVASDKTGKKLLLHDVLLALQQFPFPFCYIPRRDYRLCLASRHFKLPQQGFQLPLGLIAMLRLLFMPLLHPMGDVGVQGGFLETWGGGGPGDFPWPAGSARTKSAWAATSPVSC